MLTSQITVHNNFILKVNTILGVGSEGRGEVGGLGGGAVLLGHYGKSLAIFLRGRVNEEGTGGGTEWLLISVSRAIQARPEKDESSNSFYSWSDV